MEKNQLNNIEKENLKQFINDIYGKSLSSYDYYFIGARDRMKIKRVNNLSTIYDNFVNIIENQEDKDLYFTNQTYFYYVEGNKPRRKQININSIRTLFVDIDHIEVNHITTNKEMKEYLYNNYPFLKDIDIFPNYVTSTGHGLHLYFCLKDPFDFYFIIKNSLEMERAELEHDNKKLNQYKSNESRKKLWKSVSMMLCNLFNADVRVSTDISKILRIPYSYNCKDEKPIRGKFFNFRDEFDLYDFVDLKAKLEPLNKDNETPKPQKKSTKKKATKMKEVIVNKEPTNDDTNTNEGYKYDDDTINAIKEYYKNYEEKSKMDRRFNNIIHFLEDELLKHRNWQMYGYRDTFIFCIAKVYQNNGYGKKATKEHCIEVNKSFRRYLKDDGEQSTEEEAKLSDKEIENIINYIYDPDNKIIYNGQEVSKCDIKLSNESIKNLLDITPEEQNLYHGVSFFEEHRQLKIKIKTELKKDIYSTKKKPTKQEQLEFIKNNSDLSVYQLAQALNVTTRTILNRKKELKNDDKNKK